MVLVCGLLVGENLELVLDDFRSAAGEDAEFIDAVADVEVDGDGEAVIGKGDEVRRDFGVSFEATVIDGDDHLLPCSGGEEMVTALHEILGSHNGDDRFGKSDAALVVDVVGAAFDGAFDSSVDEVGREVSAQ